MKSYRSSAAIAIQIAEFKIALPKEPIFIPNDFAAELQQSSWQSHLADLESELEEAKLQELKSACLPVVIHQAPHEAEAVERLVRFCLELDGTVIHEFQRLEEPAGMVYPENANDSFRWVAGLMGGKPFIWIEADCVPLKPGWAQALTDEYYRQGKEYLYPLQFNLPYDAFSGIGVQGPNAYEHTPVSEKHVGFDEIIVRQNPDLIGRTDLIRHSYGIYDEKGDATLHEFPRDLAVVGDMAVLFHKDKKQGLMNIVLPGRGFEV